MLKIMHACQQDSIALYSCLGIRLRNVFDTSGVDIYLEQLKNYKEMREFNYTFEHTLKKIHCTKTPGLNQILEKWAAPKGVNEYK
jgi:ribonuclease D